MNIKDRIAAWKAAQKLQFSRHKDGFVPLIDHNEIMTIYQTHDEIMQALAEAVEVIEHTAIHEEQENFELGARAFLKKWGGGE